MPYELRYTEPGIYVHFIGNVSIEELNRANGEIQSHYGFDSHKFQLINFLDADLSSVAEEDAEFPAVTDSTASKMTRYCVKVAFIVKESYALNIVNYYVHHARQLVTNWKFGIFSTRDDAIKWATLD